MTRKTSNQQIDKLAADVAAIKSTDIKLEPDQLADMVQRMLSDNEALQKEIATLKNRIGKTIDVGSKELKTEIVERPLQSVFFAFALGFAASLMLRR